MKDYILETCVDSVESAMAAAEGGADRLELCSNLIIGGTTPGPWLFEEIRKRSDIRIHALIRPRFGDFCYTDAEFSMIRNAVKDFRKMGAEGVVDLQHAVYVGDTDGDYKATREAGIPFVHAAYGFGQTENPDYTITSPMDLVTLFVPEN